MTLLLHAYMPRDDRPAARRRCAEEDRALAGFGSRGGGQSVERMPPLFPKLEPKLEA